MVPPLPYQVLEAADRKPFYIVPNQRYTYEVPGGVRSMREVKTSPFLSFWYADFMTETAPCIAWWRHTEASIQTDADKAAAAALEAKPRKQRALETLVPLVPPLLPPGTLLVGHASKLPHRMRAQYDKTRKRLRKKQRQAIKRRGEEKKRQHRREQAALRRAAWR